MTLEQIQERMGAIEQEMLVEGADLDALTEEVRQLKTEKQSIEETAQKRENLLKEVADGKGEVVRKFEEKKEVKMEEFRNFDEALNSEAYASAFAKRFVSDNPEYTEIERRALNTTNGAALVPNKWLPEIWDAIKESHPILQDLTWQNINAVVEIPKRVAITTGDAAVITEGQCPVGEENTFTSVQVDLIEIQKMLEITAKMGMLLPEAFKTWLINEVRDRIGHKLAVEAIAKIKTQMSSANDIDAATPGTVAVSDVTKLFGLVEGAGVPKVYANRKTVFGSLFSLEGATGRDAYIPNLNDAISGNLLGAEVKQETGMADGEILMVFPQEVFFNVPGGIRVKQMEDECFKLKISGITFMGLALRSDIAAGLLTVGSAG